MAGFRYSAVSISAAGTYVTSVISWTESVPAGCSVTVEVATDGETFSTATSGAAIPGLSGDLTGLALTVKVTLTSSGTATPSFSDLSFTLEGTAQALTQPTDRYNFGQLKWLTGANAGLPMEVKRWNATTGQLVLFLPMNNDIVSGDTFEIYPGCNKASDCRPVADGGFYDNIINFRGEPHVPGQDALQAYPDAK